MVSRSSWYAIRGTAAFGVLTARPPKGYAFQYRTSHLFAKKLATGNFFLTQKALTGFEPVPVISNKKTRHHKRYLAILVRDQGHSRRWRLDCSSIQRLKPFGTGLRTFLLKNLPPATFF